jgi:hypothetical protein
MSLSLQDVMKRLRSIEQQAGFLPSEIADITHAVASCNAQAAAEAIAEVNNTILYMAAQIAPASKAAARILDGETDNWTDALRPDQKRRRGVGRNGHAR